jgi:ribonuclease VapC
VIVDTSVLVAILHNEPEASTFSELMEAADSLRMSAASYVELGIVVDGRKNPVVSRRMDEVIADAGISIEPVTERQARIAREAYRDFGRGSGHPARLNFGDCLAYALAKDMAEPMLFKGDDFSRTDVRRAIS